MLYNGVTATWTDRSFNLDDMPITSVVLDDVTGDLYASSDFGVMPIVPPARLLYAATHGRSAWVLQLP